MSKETCRNWKKNTVKGRYAQLKGMARYRGLRFDISLESFAELIPKPCQYCGTTIRISLDRVDSQQGYVLENVVPCCQQCNLMKLDYTKQEFLQKVTDIFFHHISLLTEFEKHG